MKIQFISKNQIPTKYDFKTTSFEDPKSFDLFDVNVIDLQHSSLWKNDDNSSLYVNKTKDFNSLKQIINSSNSNIIIALPQNYLFEWDKKRSGGYFNGEKLKDKISDLKCILSALLPDALRNPQTKNYNYELIFENSITSVGSSEFISSFSILRHGGFLSITTADASNHTTTLKVGKKCFVTTLDLQTDGCNFDDLIVAFGLINNKSALPMWLNEYNCFDDIQQREKIDKSNQDIIKLNEKIVQAKAKLEENLKYKSVLYTNGDELVGVVFEILEKLLVCDLSSFKDEKREDFLIVKSDITFVGEIKGVTSNVKYEHISQVEVHRSKYLDKLKEENRNEKTKTLLIINPMRNKPLAERMPVNDEQIDLSKKLGSLIITTETLLKIFEKFLNNEIASDKIISIFKTRIGLLPIEAFYADKEKVDNSVYKCR